MEDIFKRWTGGIRGKCRKNCGMRVIGGIGGLGSHTAVALARAGIGRLHIVDDDEVDLSDIHRQAYFLRQVGKRRQALTRNH